MKQQKFVANLFEKKKSLKIQSDEPVVYIKTGSR